MQSITTETTELDEALGTEEVEPRFYQAIGFVEGILEIFGQKSILKIGEDSYPIVVPKKLKAKCKTTEPQTQCFQVYPTTVKSRLGFMVTKIEKSPLSFFTLNGCWEIHNEEPRLIIYRNQQSQNDSQQRSILPLIWPDAPPADGRFWELKANLKGRELVVTEAKGSFDPPPHGFQHQQKSTHQKFEVIQSPETLAFIAAPPLTIERIQSMVAPTKAQIIFHLRQLPNYRERPDSRVRFFLNSGNGCIFSVLLKPEKFQQLVEHDFEQGVATLTGYMGAPTATGFYLIDTIVNSTELDLSSGEQLTEEDATESTVSGDSPSINSVVPKAIGSSPVEIGAENIVPKKETRSVKQQSTQESLIDQKILAVAAKADSSQEPEAKGAKSKKKASKAKSKATKSTL
jgi:hypothetical protein